MHETTLVIGRANVKSPRSIEWETILVNENNPTFKSILNDLTTSSYRKLHFLLQQYDARSSWIDNNNGKNITGLLLNADYSFSYGSDLTRTFNFAFIADGTEDLFISPQNICKFYIGLETERHTDEIIYFGLGAGVIDGPSWNVSATNRTVSFSAIDLVALINGERSGVLSYKYVWQYDQDTSVKMNIEGMIDYEIKEHFGYNIDYTDSSIANCIDTNGVEFLIQNDITSNAGTTVMDMLNEILQNSLPFYCYYFDSNGLFNYAIQPVADVNRYVQYTIPQEVVIEESTGINYTERYNDVEVWGLAQDPTNMNIDHIRDDGYTGPLICDGKEYNYPTDDIPTNIYGVKKYPANPNDGVISYDQLIENTIYEYEDESHTPHRDDTVKWNGNPQIGNIDLLNRKIIYGEDEEGHEIHETILGAAEWIEAAGRDFAFSCIVQRKGGKDPIEIDPEEAKSYLNWLVEKNNGRVNNKLFELDRIGDGTISGILADITGGHRSLNLAEKMHDIGDWLDKTHQSVQGEKLYPNTSYDNMLIVTSKEFNDVTGTTDIKCYCERLPRTKELLEYIGETTWGCNTIDLFNCTDKIRININNIKETDGKDYLWYELDGEYYIDDYNIVYLHRTPEELDDTNSYSYKVTGCGRLQVHGEAQQITGKYGQANIGVVRQVITDERISTDKECVDRANWELYKSTQYAETINLVTLPMYFIQAGQLVKYTSVITGKTNEYIVNAVSCNIGTSDAMRISLTRFYTYYEGV